MVWVDWLGKAVDGVGGLVGKAVDGVGGLVGKDVDGLAVSRCMGLPIKQVSGLVG